MLREQPTQARFEAAADTFCYLVPAAEFAAAMNASERLRAYALDHFAALLGNAAAC